MRLTLRNRYLWFFGFFAAGTGFNLNFLPPVPSGMLRDLRDFEPVPATLSPALVLQAGPLGSEVALVVAVALAVLALTVVLIGFSLISRAGLVRSVASIQRGEESRFVATWRSGVNGMWRVLGVGVLIFLLGLGLLLVVAALAGLGIALVFILTQSVGARVAVTVLISLVAALLLVAIFIPLAIIGQLSVRRTLLGGDSITGCLGGGYGMFRRNVGRSLLVWLIRLVVLLGLGIALVIVDVIVGLVLFLPTIVLAFAELTTAALVTGVIAGVLTLALFVVPSGYIGAFASAYWTLAYLRLEASQTQAGEAQ